MNTIYEKIKEAVPMSAAVERYGFEPDRKGFLSCPFHSEKTASMKIYRDSFYCFGCGAGGDVIRFAAMLFGLTNSQAAVRLNEDFGLCLTGRSPDRYRETEAQKRRAAKKRELEAFRRDYLSKCDEFRELRKRYRTAEGFEKSAITARLEYLEYWFEVTAWR